MKGIVFRGIVLLVLLSTAVGCGRGGIKKTKVTGRVTFEDGTPLMDGTVIGETGEGAKRMIAQGNIRPDGTFEWGSSQGNDGAPAGKYRVAIVSRSASDTDESDGSELGIDLKYTKFETSELVFEVTKSGPNELKITVTKPKKK